MPWLGCHCWGGIAGWRGGGVGLVHSIMPECVLNTGSFPLLLGSTPNPVAITNMKFYKDFFSLKISCHPGADWNPVWGVDQSDCAESTQKLVHATRWGPVTEVCPTLISVESFHPIYTSLVFGPYLALGGSSHLGSQ